MTSQFNCSTSRNDKRTRAAASNKASCGAINRAASGRSRVRSTWRSKSRSAKSLMMQPAERISTTPSTKITATKGLGEPIDDNHSPHNVGHRSRSMPIGLSSRISFS